MTLSWRKLVCTVVLIIICSAALAPSARSGADKDIEKLFTERSYDFYDVALNCSRLIARYYATDQLDSVHVILQYWTSESGDWMPTEQVRYLLAIDEGTFSDSMITPDLIGDLMFFRSSVTRARQRTYHGRTILDPSFDTVMQRVAVRLYAREERGSAQSLISQFYTGDVDFLFPALQSETYNFTPLGQSYTEYARQQSRRQFQYLSLSGGAWIPAGDRTTLGSHPSAGAQVGVDFKGYSIQLAFSASFLKSRNLYIFNDNGTSDTTDHFTLLYFGLEFGKQLIRTYRNEVQALIGIGGQSLMVVASEDEDKQREISSAIGSVGMRYRYYFKPYGGVFFAVEPRYSVSKLNTNGGTDLSGSAFSIRIAFGLGDIDYNSRGHVLKTLQYKY